MENENLCRMDQALLRFFQTSKLGTDQHGKFVTFDYLEHHFGKKRMPEVNKSLSKLSQMDLIEKVDDESGVFKLTPFGKMHSQSQSEVNVFSNISHSNIANKSSSINQSLIISDQPEDIQQKIKELEIAVEKRDALGMKKAFGYIADKAIDVAIAIATGALM